MLTNIIRYQLYGVFSPTKILLLIVPFIANVFFVYTSYGELIPLEKMKATIFMFYFPINFKLDLFRLLIIFVPILIIIGTFLSNEAKERNIYLLLQMKSYHLWFIGFIVASLYTVFLYFIIGFLLTYGIVLLLPDHLLFDESAFPFHSIITTNSLVLLVSQYILISLSVFLLVMLNILFVFLIHNTAFAFLLTLIFFLVSITIGYVSPSTIDFLPLAYGLIAFREPLDSSFTWVYIFSIISTFILYILVFGVFKLKKESIFRIQ